MKNFFNYALRVLHLVLKHPKGWKSLIFNTAMAKIRRATPLMMPVHITVEPTNACNLRCPVCETGNGSMARSTGLIDFEQYCKFIDQIAPTTAVLMFYFMGEPFLHKRSYEMIRYARQRNIYVETCTNGDYVNAKGIIYSDVNDISFQIGGMTQETHQIYRVRGKLDRVKNNLLELIEERKHNPQSNVKINIGFVVMKHNEHEIPEFLHWAKEIGVDRANIIDPCVRSVQEGKELLPTDQKYWFYDLDAFKHGILKPKHLPKNECTWIWNSIVVNWDGSVVPCCRDPNGYNILGNVFETPLSEIWNSKSAKKFRRDILEKQGELGICQLCSGYGVPQLLHSKPVGFEIKRLSLDESNLEIPLEGESITWYYKNSNKK